MDLDAADYEDANSQNNGDDFFARGNEYGEDGEDDMELPGEGGMELNEDQFDLAMKFGHIQKLKKGSRMNEDNMDAESYDLNK